MFYLPALIASLARSHSEFEEFAIGILQHKSSLNRPLMCQKMSRSNEWTSSLQLEFIENLLTICNKLSYQRSLQQWKKIYLPIENSSGVFLGMTSIWWWKFIYFLNFLGYGGVLKGSQNPRMIPCIQTVKHLTLLFSLNQISFPFLTQIQSYLPLLGVVKFN